MTSVFDPNQVSFDEGIKRIHEAGKRAGLRGKRRVLTSRDERAQKAQELLEVTNLPGSGFRKWQLPVYLPEPSQLFVTIADPDLEVPEHSHDEGDGIRFIAGGSIIYGDHELTAGDWMFIPAGETYSFKVGPARAILCYCYCRCCAGRMDLFDDALHAHPEPVVGP